MLTVAVPQLELIEDEREALEALARSSSSPHRAVLRARRLLLAADGVANKEVARRRPVTPNAARRWKSKFVDEGVGGVGRIWPGGGRPAELSAETVEAIVQDRLHMTPAGVTHRSMSTRSMAKQARVAKDAGARIWRRTD